MALLTVMKAKCAGVKAGMSFRLMCVAGGLGVSVLATGTACAADRSAPVLHERFGDWEVTCATLDKVAKCSALQQQGTKSGSNRSIQRTIAVEFVAMQKGAVGTLLTPFGVDLAKGVVLRLDKDGPPLPFKTCLPSGCVVPLQFGEEALRALRSHKVLHISFVTAADGRTIDLRVSLNGVGSALDRLKVLAGPN